jgi:hypothetical protein
MLPKVGRVQRQVSQIHRQDYDLDRKLGKNEVVRVPLTKGILHQIIQGQKGQTIDAERYGEFDIRFYAKVVGGNSFDGIYDEKFLRIKILWLPNGFDEVKCNKVIDSFKANVEVMREKPS